MAAVYGTNYTIAVNGPTPSTLLNPCKWKGKVRVQADTYECVSVVAGTTIYVAKIPMGSMLLGISNIVADDLSSAGTLAVGDGTTADLYKAATVFTTAGQQTFINAIAGLQSVVTADTDIILTTATNTLNGTIKTEIYYAID